MKFSLIILLSGSSTQSADASVYDFLDNCGKLWRNYGLKISKKQSNNPWLDELLQNNTVSELHSLDIEDVEELTSYYKSLSTKSFYNSFHGGLTPDAVSKTLLERADGQRNQIVAVRGSSNEIIATGRMAPFKRIRGVLEPSQVRRFAEVSLDIHDQHQNTNLSLGLLSEMRKRALANKYESIVMHVSSKRGRSTERLLEKNNFCVGNIIRIGTLDGFLLHCRVSKRPN